MGATHQYCQDKDGHPNGRANPAYSLYMGRLLPEGEVNILRCSSTRNLIQMQHLVLATGVDET